MVASSGGDDEGVVVVWLVEPLRGLGAGDSGADRARVAVRFEQDAAGVVLGVDRMAEADRLLEALPFPRQRGVVGRERRQLHLELLFALEQCAALRGEL